MTKTRCEQVWTRADLYSMAFFEFVHSLRLITFYRGEWRKAVVDDIRSGLDEVPYKLTPGARV